MKKTSSIVILFCVLAIGLLLYFCTGCNESKQLERKEKRVRKRIELQSFKSPKVAAEFCRDRFPITQSDLKIRKGAFLSPGITNYIDTGGLNPNDTNRIDIDKLSKLGIVFTTTLGHPDSMHIKFTTDYDSFISFRSKTDLYRFFKQCVADGTFKIKCPECPPIQAPDTIPVFDPAPVKAAVISKEQEHDKALKAEANVKTANKYLLWSAIINLIQLIILVIMLYKKFKRI
jgi:hypothetical protein